MQWPKLTDDGTRRIAQARLAGLSASGTRRAHLFTDVLRCHCGEDVNGLPGPNATGELQEVERIALAGSYVKQRAPRRP